MASEVEQYLDDFEAVQRLAVRLVGVADQLLEVSQLLRGDPDKTLASIPSEWPTAEQLRALITDMATAEKQLALRWAKLPERIRDAMPNKHPDNSGDVGFSDE
jgi:hypothetical protein